MSWNGTVWTRENNLNTAVVGNGGSGTQAAALNSGGQNPSGKTAGTEEWMGDGIITETVT